jgi:7 transmembrane receptor (rhodopsin family)
MKSIVARPCQLRLVVSVADNHSLSVSAVSVTVTVWTLVAISMERYFAICRPLQSRQWQTRFHAYKVIAYVWMAALALNSPILIMSRLQATRDKGNYCNRFCTLLSCAFVCERPAITRPAEVFLSQLLVLFAILCCERTERKSRPSDSGDSAVNFN